MPNQKGLCFHFICIHSHEKPARESVVYSVERETELDYYSSVLVLES